MTIYSSIGVYIWLTRNAMPAWMGEHVECMVHSLYSCMAIALVPTVSDIKLLSCAVSVIRIIQLQES